MRTKIDRLNHICRQKYYGNDQRIRHGRRKRTGKQGVLLGNAYLFVQTDFGSLLLWDNGGELDRQTYEFKPDGLEQALNRALEIGEEPTKEPVEETTAA